VSQGYRHRDSARHAMPSATTVLLRTQSDERLVALARAGHERAFEAIVERYRRPLLRACRRVLPEARAEDAVQQALVAAWTALARGDEVRELRPWLYRIAHHTALNQLRVSGYDYDELRGLLDGGPGPDEQLERREVARATLKGLAALPARQREALLQVAVQGRGQDEVARALGVSEPAVRQLVHRARTQLRAAATALTPMPLAGWLANLGAGGAPVADRVGEAAAGGGAAGVAATVAKVGAVVVLAGAAAPGVVDRVARDTRGGSPAAGAATATAAERARPATRPPAGVTERVALVRPVATRHVTVPTPVPRSEQRRGEPERSRSDDGGGASGRRSGDDGVTARSHEGTSGGGDDRSGSSSGDDAVAPSPTPTADRSGTDGGGTSGGPGPSTSDDAPAPLATPTPVATLDSSRSGRDGGGDDHLDGSSGG
jgi:RNA polymerase sigma factor (sigma-70 family)